MIAQIVRFKSALTEDQVKQKYNDRAPRYREMQGLKQKYYLRFPETNEFGAVYLWESESALNEFRESDLGKTIAAAYKVEGDPVSRKAEVVMTLREG